MKNRKIQTSLHHILEIVADKRSEHPAETEKLIRPSDNKNEVPWEPVGIIFDVFCFGNTEFQLITINGRKATVSEPADWRMVNVPTSFGRASELNCGPRSR